MGVSIPRALSAIPAKGPWWANLALLGVIAAGAIGTLCFAGGTAVGGVVISARERRRRRRARERREEVRRRQKRERRHVVRTEPEPPEGQTPTGSGEGGGTP